MKADEEGTKRPRLRTHFAVRGVWEFLHGSRYPPRALITIGQAQIRSQLYICPFC